MSKVWYDYESANATILTRRLPVIIKSIIKDLSKTDTHFNSDVIEKYNKAIIHASKNIEGCVSALRTGSEVNFILRNDWNSNTIPWYNNNQQKLTSVTTSYLIIGGASHIFETTAFVVPSLMETIQYFAFKQFESFNFVLSELLAQQLKEDNHPSEIWKIANSGSLQDKLQLLSDFEIDIKSIPEEVRNGNLFYKAPILINGDYKQKWFVDSKHPKDMDNFLSEVLVTGADIFRTDRLS